MEKLMQELAEKLCADREKEPPVKNNYRLLLETIFFKEDLDRSLDDCAQLAEAVTQTLSALSDIEKYCLEERYLHGKSQSQLAEEFRRNLDMEEFTDKLIDNVYHSIEHEFMDTIHSIFFRMKENSFRELEYLDGMHPDNLPKNDTYYEPDADKSIVDMLRYTVKMFDGMGICYKDIFEKYFMKGETKEKLAQWLSENMQDFVSDRCRDALRYLRIFPSNSRPLKRFIEPDGYNEECRHDENKCRSCIYMITAGIGDRRTDCSLCRTDEVRNWLDKALSELPTKERQVMRALYDLEDGHYSSDHKKTAVKLRIDSKESVRKLERRALKNLSKKAMREL